MGSNPTLSANEIINGKMIKMSKLTNKQIERQDFVDNQIFELMQSFIPSSKKIKWDIEMIASVRDAIQEQIVDNKKIMSEFEFYP